MGDASGLDISNFERIEVVRGPGSTLYGNNAIHAVINLIPNKNLNSYIPLLSLKYGSYNNKVLGIRTTKHVNEDLSFSIYGTYQESDGEDLYFKEFDTPDNNNGWAINQDKSLNQGLLTSVDYKKFKLQGMYSKARKNIPTAPFSSEFNKKQIQAANNGYLEFSWSPELSYNKFLIFKASYDYQKYWTNLPFKFIADDIVFEGKSSTIGAELQFVWDIFQSNRIIIVTEYKNNFDSKYKYFSGDLNILNDVWSYKIFSLFFQNEYQYNADLSIYAGLRGDSFIGQEYALNPRVGIVYSPFNNHTFKFLYGRSFRAPNLVERNIEERNIVRFKKNENLISEFITTAEIIWDYKISNSLSSTFSLFNYNMDGLIDQVIDPVDDLFQYVNTGKVKANGAELELNYKINKSGRSYFRYSYQLSKDENDEILSNSPEHLIKFGITNKLINILNGSFDIIYETERRTLYGHFTKPILLAGVNLFTDQILDHFRFSLKVRNLFNSTIKHPGGYEIIQESIIKPYRNYLFTVTLEL